MTALTDTSETSGVAALAGSPAVAVQSDAAEEEPDRAVAVPLAPVVAEAVARQGGDRAIVLALKELDDLLDGGVYATGPGRELIDRAAALAIDAHNGMRRRSGEPYSVHPIAVASLLAKMQLDAETVAAALLHDVVEDTETTLEHVGKGFGERVAKLVDGVTKLGQIPWVAEPSVSGAARREKQQQDENLRKMFLAMVDDIGVVLIKLADRLHNMRTLGAMPRDKQLKIAQQTMEIYAPLANRLGIWQFKSELEDLAFRYLNPDAYEHIADYLRQREPDRIAYIERVKSDLWRALSEAGIEAELTGRGKHIYSIWRKMQKKQLQVNQIYDVVGIRVLVDTKRDCYGALGVIHGRWHPIPQEFDDYIANPKDSMYQSLHTAVVGLEGQSLEIQIRTREMHQVAEYGVAAHWRYEESGKADQWRPKDGNSSSDRLNRKIAWLHQLMDWRDEISDAEEFVEQLKTDVFQDQIYVFTPAGDIIELPSGATPVDFAYRIHTEIGHHCVGAKVNDAHVPLDYKLQNGQVVRITTSKTKVGPSRDWLQAENGYVTTASAREKIRQWFRRRLRDENIAQGKETLERELRRLSLECKPDDLLKHFPQYTKADDLLAAIGYGAISPQVIAVKLGETRKEELTDPTIVRAPRTPARVDVMGAGGLLTNLATCCKPVLGDDIIGYTTRGRGITIHRRDCSNIANLPDPERLIPVSWGDQGGATFPVAIRVQAWDRVGLLKDVSTLLADEKVNILSVLTNTFDDRTVTLLLTLEVDGVPQLLKMITKLEGIKDVVEVRRDATPIVPRGERGERLAVS